MNKRVYDLIQQYEAEVLQHFHWLHAHPELSGQEKETAAYVAKQLRAMGLEPTENVGGYGVVAVIEGCCDGRCVGLRADMDALPMTERTGLPYASQNEGVMHSCGHDAHTAMLLGAARVLTEMRDAFRGRVKLVFQPSEENSMDSGAKRMIADGVMENPHVDAMIGQHVSTQRDVGSISTKPGTFSSASDRFFITLEGKAAHAAQPDAGVDTIAVGAQIVTALQTIVSRNVSPKQNAVVTIGKFNGGDRYNVVAGQTVMEGTCRTQNPDVRDLIEKRMGEIVHGIAEGMGATCKFQYIRGYSPVVNAPDMVELLRETATELYGEDSVVIFDTPGMGGEDFSFFCEQVPCVFYYVGCHKKGAEYISAHNERMVVDPACFPMGMRVMVTTALKYLNA